MTKKYMIWWHTKFVEEISRDTTTIKEITDKVGDILEPLEQLRGLEEQGKIRVNVTGALNPLFIQVLDSSIEPQVVNNPLVEVEETDED